MRLAVAGCNGRMGKALVQATLDSEGVTLNAATVSPLHPLIGSDVGLIAGLTPLNIKATENLNKVVTEFDTLIDFTNAAATLSHVAICLKHQKNMVIGTTGLTEAQKHIIQEASNQIAIVFAPNMSVSVNLCFQLIKQAAKILGDSVDIEIIEAHHRHKIDAPSGTALKMGEVIATTLNRDLEKVAVYDRHKSTASRKRESIGFSSIRGGDMVGEHTVLFAGDGERLEITHRASNRNTYAFGAIRAAKWLKDKKNGLYTMAQVLGLD